VGKFAAVEPVFAVQLLLRVESTVPGRAPALLHGLLAAFDQWSGDNRWKVAGWSLGVAHLGADSVLFRRRFDRRYASGRFAPRRLVWLTVSELGGLLKPPTVHCRLDNVVRSGGLVPDPPRSLPTWRLGDPELFYLGVVDTDTGERHVGAPLADTFFTLGLGRSRYGKTELMLARFAALALADRPAGQRTGAILLDPHSDALTKVRPLLCAPGVADRVLEVDLTPGPAGLDARSAGWNPLSMEGLTVEDIDDKVGAMVAAVTTALNWGDNAPRACTLLTKAVETLCELALLLPADCAPTVFQIPTLLTDARWRDAVIDALSPGLAGYWTDRFPRTPPDATNVVTNIFDRLRSSKKIAALLGSSRSTFDLRAAMDAGALVLLCPAGTGDKDRLMANLFIFEIFRAAMSRRDLPESRRRRVDAFLDELAAIDGAARGSIAGILEQTAKFGLRLHLSNQLPQRLTATTRDAVLGNRSHLFTSALGEDAARIVAKEWGRDVDSATIAKLDRFHHIGQVTLHGQLSRPFRLRGVALAELFAGHRADPAALAGLDAAIDRTMRRRRARDIVADLATLDARILDRLGAAEPPARAGRPPAGTPGQPRAARGGTSPVLAPPAEADRPDLSPGPAGPPPTATSAAEPGTEPGAAVVELRDRRRRPATRPGRR
jgi:hypothetical protein